MFEVFHPINIFNSQLAHRNPYNKNDFQKGSSNDIFHFTMKQISLSAASSRSYLPCYGQAHKKSKLLSYHQVVNYLLVGYAIVRISGECDMAIMKLKQPTNGIAVEYTQALWSEALRWGAAQMLSLSMERWASEVDRSWYPEQVCHIQATAIADHML